MNTTQTYSTAKRDALIARLGRSIAEMQRRADRQYESLRIAQTLFVQLTRELDTSEMQQDAKRAWQELHDERNTDGPAMPALLESAPEQPAQPPDHHKTRMHGNPWERKHR